MLKSWKPKNYLASKKFTGSYKKKCKSNSHISGNLSNVLISHHFTFLWGPLLMLPSYWLSFGPYPKMYCVSVQCNAGIFYSLFVWVMILTRPKPKIYFRKKFKGRQKALTLNCSTPSKEKLSCLGEHYYHKILLSLYYSTYTEVSHLLPRPTEKNQLLDPHKRYWAEILGIISNSLNLSFELVLVNPIGTSN